MISLKPFCICVKTSIDEDGYMRVEWDLYHTNQPSKERKEQVNNKRICADLGCGQVYLFGIVCTQQQTTYGDKWDSWRTHHDTSG
jgi:hypothetical protein